MYVGAYPTLQGFNVSGFLRPFTAGWEIPVYMVVSLGTRMPPKRPQQNSGLRIQILQGTWRKKRVELVWHNEL